MSRVGLLTVGETARILGVSPSTLRLWENVGLISPARSNGRYRLYSPELLEVLKRIKYLRDVKLLNLPGIRQALGKPPSTVENQRQHADRSGAQAAGPPQEARPRRGRSRAARQDFRGLSERHRAVARQPVRRHAAAARRDLWHDGPDFYDLPKHSNRLVRVRDRRAIQTQSGVKMELLSIGARQLESMIFRVQPGAGSDGSYSHQGEEFIYMMAGTLEIWLDELECHTLREGDSFWFESTVGHRWYNPSNEESCPAVDQYAADVLISLPAA